MTLSENEEVGKLFVGGLSWESTKENLHQYFSQFGEVVDCVVMKNNETGRPRGFGFVTFKDPECVSIVLSSGTHQLDGRMIDPKACTPRSIQKAKRSGNFPKVFLGGLPTLCTETELRTCFSEYGRVIDVVIMYDQEKKKTRGFGFLSFESEESVDRVCSQRYVIFGNKQVECKRAEPRELSKLRSRHTLPSASWSSPGMGMPSSGGWAAMPVNPSGQDMSAPQMMPPVPSGYQPGWSTAQQQVPYSAPPSDYQQTSYNWNAPAPAPAPAAYGYSPYGDTGSNYAQQNYMGYAMPPAGYTYGNYTTSVNTVPSAVSYPIIKSQNSFTSGALNAQSSSVASSVPATAVSQSSAYAASSIPSYSTEPESSGSGSPVRSNVQTASYHPYRRV